MNNKPKNLTILGKSYTIEYCDNPANVDINKRESLWGQVDYWTRTIRIYDIGRNNNEDIWHYLIHEILHVFGQELKLECFEKGYANDQKKHEELDIIALALTDTLFRNNLIRIE